MPQVNSRQLLDPTGNCAVHLSWNVPTMNNISHYTVKINGTHIANETAKTNDSSVVTVYPLCSCGSHNISISTVNRCGSTNSRSTYNIILADQVPAPQLPMMCITTTTSTTSTPQSVTNGGNECQGNRICIL